MNGQPHDDLPRRRAEVVLHVYDAPENKRRPSELIGREPLIDEINGALDARKRVLLHGLGGNGKTSLAATVADARVSAGSGRYGWLEVGEQDEHAVFEAIVRELATKEDLEKINQSAPRPDEIKHIVAGARLALVVLDDVWSGPALVKVLDVMPDKLPVLVTSRIRYPTAGPQSPLDVDVEVGDLTPGDALSLLVRCARVEEFAFDPEAAALCRDLGYHAFAVEIAGCHLSHHRLSPARLRASIREEPDALDVPGRLTLAGRDSVRALLNQSYRALNETQATVFKAFGAMYGPGATVELLAVYLGMAEPSVRRALGELDVLSLARAASDARFFSVHALTFSYARARHNLEPASKLAMVAAVRAFVRSHVAEHDLLALDIDNVLGAAALASQGEAAALVSILSDLASGGYVDNRGHGSNLLDLLDAAIEAARRDPSTQGEVLHHLLCKRANAYVDLDEAAKAIPVYQEALSLAPDTQRRVIVRAVMGKVYYAVNRPRDAFNSFAEAFAIAEATGDRQAILRALESHSVAAFREKNFEVARDVANTGIELSQRFGDPHSEMFFLVNRASADFEIVVRASRRMHEEAAKAGERLKDKYLQALATQALGIDHHALEEHAEAKTHLRAAAELYEQLNHAQDEKQIKAMMRRFGYLD